MPTIEPWPFGGINPPRWPDTFPGTEVWKPFYDMMRTATGQAPQPARVVTPEELEADGEREVQARTAGIIDRVNIELKKRPLKFPVSLGSYGAACLEPLNRVVTHCRDAGWITQLTGGPDHYAIEIAGQMPEVERRHRHFGKPAPLGLPKCPPGCLVNHDGVEHW